MLRMASSHSAPKTEVLRILAEEKPKDDAKAAAPTLEDYYLYVFGDAESNTAVP